VPATRTVTAKRARTSARLVDAATEVVARRGFHAASVDEIARRAGYSIGALYSNFKSKDDLFLAVFDGHLEWFERQLETVSRSDDPAVAASGWMDLIARNPDQFLVFVEFWAYAVRRPRVRPRFAARMARMRAAMTASVDRIVAESGRPPPMPPERAALLMLAAGRGLAMERLADPDAFEDDVVEGLVQGMAG
jgi:AcrR family transcriptional regulator